MVVESLGGQVAYQDVADKWFTSHFPSLFGRVTGLKLGGLWISRSGHQFDVISTRATNQDVAKLIAAFPDLESLGLDSTLVTDEVVVTLKTRHRLKWVNLCNTGVTEKGLRKLKSSLPNCDARIYHLITEDVNYSDWQSNYYQDLITD